ncbi:MAG: hypothetical protein QM504_18825 [Pseudomonadota bacterium]
MGISGPFVADDVPNIINNQGLFISKLSFDELYVAASSGHSGPLGRPISYISFALNYLFSGQELVPTHFKLTNLFIHTINSILLFFISKILFTQVVKIKNRVCFLAFIATAIWAIHPIQLTTILYVVQRMNLLSTLFSLIGILLFLNGRKNLDKKYAYTKIISGLLIGVILGSFSKENALLLPFLFLVIEITLFKKSTLTTKNKKNLYLFYLFTSALPFLFIIIIILTKWDSLFSYYQFRTFTLNERLLTESRVLWYYISLIFYPDTHQFSFFNDDFSVSHSLFQPWNTFLSLTSLLALISFAIYNIFRGKKHHQLVISFALLWFFIGHSMESSVFPLELVFEHRNYLPSYGLIFAFIYYSQLLRTKINNKFILYAFYFFILMSLTIATSSRAKIWSDPGTIISYGMRNHPSSPRALASYAAYLKKINGSTLEIYTYQQKKAILAPKDVVALIEMATIISSLISNNDKAIEHYFSTKNKPPVAYSSDLVLDKNYLPGLLKLIHKEILYRLKNKVNSVDTSNIIEQSAKCITADIKGCALLIPYFIPWAEQIIQNKHFDHNVIRVYVMLAKVHFFNQQPQLALKYINAAIARSNNRYYPYLEKATLYIKLKKWELAIKNIEIAHKNSLSYYEKDQVQKVKNMLIWEKNRNTLSDKKAK